MIYLKEKHQTGINYFAANRSGIIRGDKLKALYHLIQKKGELMKSDDKKLNGVKAVWYSKNDGIAMIRTGVKDSFFPCAIRTIQITKL